MRTQPGDSISFRPLLIGDYESAIRVRDDILVTMDAPDLMVPPDDRFIREILKGGGISLGAFSTTELVGFISFRQVVGHENLGFIAGHPHEYYECAWNLEHSLVREPYRRHGIFHRLFSLGVKRLELPTRHCYKSISPRNYPSLMAASKEGFEIIAMKQLYCSVERFILHYPALSLGEECNLQCAHLQDVSRIAQLLHDGYTGRLDFRQRGRVLFTRWPES